jgi:uncharacterized protein (TIGR00269 family)
MVVQTDHLGIGYSGGKDSTILLHILSKMNSRFPNTNLTALTIDEGIDGYSNNSIELTQKITRKYDVKHVVISFKEIYGTTLDKLVEEAFQRKSSLSPCAICGILRRRALNYAAKQANVTKIATAHNLDDEAQSIVMNLLRGDSKKFKRYSRVPIQKYKTLPPRIRPLVLVTEPEIVLYAHANDLKYHSEPCPYSSSALRNKIRNFLSMMEKIHPSTLINVINLHDSLLQQFPQISNLEPLHQCKRCREVSTYDICPVCQLLDDFGFANPFVS